MLLHLIFCLPHDGSATGTVHVLSVSVAPPVQAYGPGQVLVRVRVPV